MDIRNLENEAEIISTVAEWIYREWGHLVKGRTFETAKSKVRQSLGPEDIPMTLVCYIEGKPVGTAGLDTADMSTHPELSPWMVSVYVKPAYRRRGVGAALCKRIVSELGKLDFKTAYLFTPDQERFYERLGWKTFAREEYRGEKVVIMRIDLD